MTTTRARDLGIDFDGSPGSHNSITDVPGVEVGFTTLINGDGEHAVRTGVTAILPRGRGGVGDPCQAGMYSMNGNGEFTGAHWIAETGLLHLPIGVTNSHAVGPVHRGIIDWVAQVHPDVASEWLLPCVGETYDGDLNDINGRHVTPEHAVAALDAAMSGAVPEGNVGGGTGMNCYEFKGGTGTASRAVTLGPATYTVGVLLQANFGDRDELTVRGVPLGRQIDEVNPFATESRPACAGSVIVIVATDAPLIAQQCAALARRVPLGLARTGTTGSHYSGDIFLAFSTANSGAMRVGWESRPAAGSFARLDVLQWSDVDSLYAATVQAVEEATVNALVAAETMIGRNGFRSPELPLDQVRRLLHL
ncbi:MAG TPA: P1 family peptidase [Actinomycetes bacterium]|nr:P1 family peptidase [Actinomycetes bacterium]